MAISSESPSEGTAYASVQEMIQALESIMPEAIRERYLVGKMWDQIKQQEQRAPDDVVESPLGLMTIKKIHGCIPHKHSDAISVPRVRAGPKG